MFTIDRTKTNYKELNDILDAIGQYPVLGKDIDGTKIWISWEEPENADPFPTVWEPGTDEHGTKITAYFSDGSTSVSYKN